MPVHETLADEGVAGGIPSLDGSALVPVNQLGTGAADATTFLRGDRVWSVPAAGSGGSSVVDRQHALLTIVNLNTEQTLYTVTITAGSLGTNKCLRLSMFGDYLNNSGATQTATLRIKYGATTMYQDLSLAVASTSISRAWSLMLLLANQDATNSQSLVGQWLLGNNDSPATGQAGGLNSGTVVLNTPMIGADAAVNSALAQSFTVTWQFTNANANLRIRRQYAILELL